MDKRFYTSPFIDRYGTHDMRFLFSDGYRHSIWRDLWYILAYAQHKCGAPISTEQLQEIDDAMDEPIDYDNIEEYEKETHHDVVAHLMEFSDHCPTAKNILHLGATSCYITDNADIIIMHAALNVIKIKLNKIINYLTNIASTYKDTPLVGRTHLQKAQLTTVGKRISMWINDFDIDYQILVQTLDTIKLLGCKGATGSQSSLYTLFDGDYEKAQKLDRFISDRYNIDHVDISGQTYTRKYDSIIAHTLSQIAQSASKMATDIRLMSSFGEMYEGFGEKQVGSSAMPYKRNPITCEKICGISRYIICNSQNMAITASTQWLERTLDDSSNKRIVMAELFLSTSEVLSSIAKILDNIVVNTDMCTQHAEEHSKMASLEDDIIRDVIAGGDRLEGHKDAIWSNGSDNAQINTGFAKEQTTRFINKIKMRG